MNAPPGQVEWWLERTDDVTRAPIDLARLKAIDMALRCATNMNLRGGWVDIDRLSFRFHWRLRSTNQGRAA